MSLDTLAFCSQKMQRHQSCNFFAIFKKLPAVASAPASGRRIGFVRFVEHTVQENGLDFRFLLSRKIDPPLRSVAVREARAKRATTACCGGKNFFFLGVYRVSARIWGFRNWGGPSKRPPKKNFSPRKSGRRALRARLPAGHRVERRRVHQV